MKTKEKVKMGKVILRFAYAVDLNNPDMVAEARDAIYEDAMMAFKYGNLNDYIKTEEAPDAKESDIPSFLLTEND